MIYSRRTRFVLGLAGGFAAGVIFAFAVSELNSGTYSSAVSSGNSGSSAKDSGQAADGQSDVRLVTDNAALLGSASDDWCLALISESNPLDTDYVPPSLTRIDDSHSVDSRIAESLQQMLADGRAKGLDMYVTSAYRTLSTQTALFNNGVLTRMRAGMTPLEAYNNAKQSIALPGTSEHAAGIAVDIIASQYTELDERQADTPEQQWLMAHCWEYGFILRYPQDSISVTGITYEPWHYRYVGRNAAEEITKRGITLEEYLNE